jgi:hypothetical protein
LGGDDVDFDELGCDAPKVIDGFCEWVVGPGSTATSTAASAGEVKWIAQESMADLYEKLKAFCVIETDLDGNQCPSLSTMTREWHETWKRCLKMRQVGHHSRCADCEKFKEFRRMAQSPEDFQGTTAAYHAHLTKMRANRRIDMKLQGRSESTAKARNTDEGGMHTHMDAVDQAKLKTPKELSASKEFSNCWRPQLLLVGGMSFGSIEAFFLMDSDMKKDANLECTLMSRLFQLTMASLEKKCVPAPKVWSHMTDNATAEGKNQTMAKFAAWLVNRRKFNSAELMQNSVGHTHGPEDQRLSEACAALGHTDKLHTPTHFVQVLQRRVQARQGRELVVEKVEATLNWISFFEQLGVKMAGHTSSHTYILQGIESCHVWRFLRREDVQWDGPIQSAWPEVEHHPCDVILLVKAHMSDTTLCQDPVVFCTNAKFAALPPGGKISHKGSMVGASTAPTFR